MKAAVTVAVEFIGSARGVSDDSRLLQYRTKYKQGMHMKFKSKRKIHKHG
jgi:hypothetical protein